MRIFNFNKKIASQNTRDFHDIVISQFDYEKLINHLFQLDDLEQTAFLLCGINRFNGGVRVLVREVIPVEAENLIAQEKALVESSPEEILEILDRNIGGSHSIVVAHSHPFCNEGVYKSAIDVHTELSIFPWLAGQKPKGVHASIVFGKNSVDGHYWDTGTRTRRPISSVRVIGNRLKIHETTSSGLKYKEKLLDYDRFDRQVRAFGKDGQRLLASLCTGLIGCGGLATPLAQMLAYLGVRHFIVVDDDTVEMSNLNRLIGAFPFDVKDNTPKVAVLERLVKQIAPNAEVTSLEMSVAETEARNMLKGCDVLIGCTDSDGARLVGNELALRYLIPFWDMGSGIIHKNGALQDAGGQVWQVLPDGPCLQCAGFIDAAAARVELMSDLEQRRHLGRGYGTDEVAPSVIFLNTMVASLMVQELMNFVAPFKKPASIIVYDALRSRVETLEPPRIDPNCPVCSRMAIRGAGDEDAVPEGLFKEVPVMDG